MKLDGRGDSIVVLPSLLVVDVTAVSDGTAVLDVETDLEWSENGVLERRCWTRKRRGIEVTFEHGHDPVPADVVDLVCALAARGIIAQRAANVVKEQAGTNSVTLGAVGGTNISIDVLPHESAKLKRFILPERA